MRILVFENQLKKKRLKDKRLINTVEPPYIETKVRQKDSRFIFGRVYCNLRIFIKITSIFIVLIMTKQRTNINYLNL